MIFCHCSLLSFSLSLFCLLTNVLCFEKQSALSPKRHIFRRELAASAPPINITVLRGTEAELPCHFRSIGDNKVSWIRTKDYHVLTTGDTKISDDDHIMVPKAPNWALFIQYVDEDDSGIYECSLQMTTEKKTLSRFVNLNVVVLEATIKNGRNLRVTTGTTIKLTCNVENVASMNETYTPEFVFWYKNDRIINYEQSKGEITVATTIEAEDKSSSILTIHNADDFDTGNYSCMAANAKPAHINVIVAQATTIDPLSGIRHLFPRANISQDFSPKNITIQHGTSAYLPCNFNALGTHQVSWIRRRDFHILTTGIHTYTNDERFVVQHQPDTDIWTLLLKYAQESDSGIYECQLSTGTGSTSRFINLEVLIPQAIIVGGTEYHVQTGSTIKLVCAIENKLKTGTGPTFSPSYVFWYKNERMINYDHERGGIQVRTQMDMEDDSVSILSISNAEISDSGNYSCVIANAQPAYSNVFVSQGDKMAAIQRRESSRSANLSGCSGFLLNLSIVWSLQIYFQDVLQMFYTFTSNSATFISTKSYSSYRNS